MNCGCGPYYDCAEHDTDPVRSRDGWKRRALAAESRLAAANALLEDTAALSYCPTWLKTAIRSHLAAQPATAPGVSRG